ncbi:hypothetical protein WN51_01679 [Melipona quadrifasciata]|uniref:Uncharacterized protein n=1 Tax=Melipona quadrifasciata TaxID=166423 RepID=A0A0M8ZWD4_9HYME|nr:hypothetical protein WN51_01679 [Melipona quadrifasciata]
MLTLANVMQDTVFSIALPYLYDKHHSEEDHKILILQNLCYTYPKMGQMDFHL